MISRTGLVTNFSGELGEEGFVIYFENTRGKEDALLGEIRGTLPIGSRDGNGLFAVASALEQFTKALKEVPTFAPSIKDSTKTN